VTAKKPLIGRKLPGFWPRKTDIPQNDQ